MKNVKAKVVLDKRFKKVSGKYPVKLRLTYSGTQQYYPLNVDLNELEFSKCVSDKAKGELQKIRLIMIEAERRAFDVLSRLRVFTFQAFEQAFFGPSSSSLDVFAWYESIIIEMKAKKRLGTVSNYECSMHSLQKMRKKLHFHDVDIKFLEEYQEMLLSQGRSKTTVGIYLRPLRHVFNCAIDKGILTKQDYPFGKSKYQIPGGRNIKKAISKDQVLALMKYVPDTPAERYARDIFIFSYLGNGMNMKDIALLKWSNIDGEILTFQRAKTENTNTSSLPIVVPILKEMESVFQRWGNRENKSEYIFPIISSVDSLEVQRKKIQQFTKQVNKYLKRISAKLEFPHKITTYTARHTYSTVMKNAGVSVEFISEALGHSSIQTTRSYLASFDAKTKIELSKELIRF
jgi:integrase